MKRKYASLCLLVVAVIAIPVVLESYKQAGVYTHASAIQSLQPDSVGQLPTVGPIRNLRFTLFREGIRPNEMRIKAGMVNISFEDKTHVAEGLRLNHVFDGGRLALGFIQKAPNQARGRTSFRLIPGEYELYDASQPLNKAVLVVEP